ncbi:MAG: hypothetical protein FWF12_03005 [Betaproteobacteria bacterium]|nr:hypothetical protein [Betaproteobacteria bacterium]
MRLLSIFALLFLISILLHGGLKEWNVPEPLDEHAEHDMEEVADAGPVQAEQEDFSSLIFSQPYPVRHFDFEQEDIFSIIEIEIKNLIVGRNDDSFKTKNHLCAVGYEFPRQGKKKGFVKKEVVVYWREAKMLYRWMGGDPKAAAQDFYNARSLMYSRSIPLDPDRDMIGVEGKKNGDGFDDYTERAEKVVADCKMHGKVYEIEPFRPPPRGFKIPEGGGHRPHPPATPPTPVTPASSPLV